MLPRPGADSKISDGIPSLSSRLLMYCAACVSFPGGLLVLILIRFTRMSAASLPADGPCAIATVTPRKTATEKRSEFRNMGSILDEVSRAGYQRSARLTTHRLSCQ